MHDAKIQSITINKNPQNIDDLSHISPYSQEYINEIYKNKNELKELLKNQPLKRLDSIKAEIKKDLEKGYDKIKASLKDLERVDIQISNPDITDDIKKN